MPDRLKDLFAAASELPAAEREHFVATNCGDDGPMRDRLAALLRAHDAAGEFLEHPADLVADAAVDVASSGGDGEARSGDGLAAGAEIGNYTLVAPLGHGGFGSVWRAHQRQPVVRDVALKVLHTAVDTERVVARFAAEWQTLARMQHPGIAKVLDAGATPGGRPWLAMELIDGRPLLEVTAARRLPVADRLALFVEVCVAVQHAHGKGVVHRDLKPSNVLVVERDGGLAPVVIDFGVARVADAGAADTGDEGGLTGTPEYMSPEQASFDRAAVDTRTDVHSLGVLLYELVAGVRPFVRPPGLHGAQELLRLVRETLPLPPSRQPTRIAPLPRELDWIVARAMAKDPAARYPTAAALADDVRRLSRHEPVQAGPNTAGYRLRKAARRHRVAFALVALVVLSIGIGAVVAVAGWAQAHESAVQARAAEALAVAAQAQAEAAEQRARADQIAAERESRKANRALDLVDELWEAANPARFGRPDYPVRELFGDFERLLPARFAGEPEVELRLRLTLARLQRILGMLPNASAHSLRAVEVARSGGEPAELADALVELARAEFDRGEVVAAERAGREALALREGLPGVPTEDVAIVLETLANCRLRQGDRAGAAAFAERAAALRDAEGEPLAMARSCMQLASLHGGHGRIDVAMARVRDALDLLAPFGEGHPDALVALQHLAFLQQRRGEHAEAEASFRESLARRQRLYGDDHPHVAWAEADLGWLLHERGRAGEAEPLLRHALGVLTERLGDAHVFTTEAMQRLGAVLAALDRFAEAETMLTTAAERFARLEGHPVDGLVSALGNLAKLHWRRGDREQAVRVQADALQKAREQLPAAHFVCTIGLTNLAHMRAELGEIEPAVALLREALTHSTAAGRPGEAKIQRQRLADLLDRLGRADEAAAVRDGR
jgi:tetratricopeptide (TPR) repeat protein